MTDHQTHSQNPDDAGKPPNDDWSDSYLAAQWAKIWDDLRPSVRPAWLGPKPAGPTAHYWVNADGSAVRTAVDTGDAGFRAGDVVRVVNGRIARSLPDQVGPGHDDPRAGIVSTVPPNTGPPPSITWADVVAMYRRLTPPRYRPTDWHWQPTPGGGWYSGPPNPRITTEPCQCHDDDGAGACTGALTGHTCPCPACIDDECGKPWAEHPPARVVPSVPPVALTDEEAHTCHGTGPWPAPCGRDTPHRAHPLGIPPTDPPEPDWHKGCTWCWRTIWHTTNQPTIGEQP